MLEYNRMIHKRVTLFTRLAALLLPLLCIALVLSQTAFAKNTYVIDDGGKVTYHTTYATDPEKVLSEAGLSLNKDDIYTTSSDQGVSKITVQRLQRVTVVHSGKSLSVTTYGESVESLLNRLDFKLAQNDILSAALSDATYDGMTLTITRDTTTEESYVVTIPFKTTYCYDAELPKGEEKVLISGSEGQMQCVASIRYMDGKEVSRTVLSQTVVVQPVDALIAIGTYVEPPPAPEPEPEPEPEPTPEPEKKPESTPSTGTGKYIIGDGVIITPTGEKLTYSRCETFRATAYCREEEGGQITALGTPTRVGAIAVDPKVIPYGTRMFIRSQDGKYIYGVAVAEDCGGSIKGKRIDLFYETMPECVQFGIRDCDVFFLN